MNDAAKVVRYECPRDRFMDESKEGAYVTHADYQALEEKYADECSASIALSADVSRLGEELASLRGKVGDAPDQDDDEDDEPCSVCYSRDCNGECMGDGGL